MNEVGGVNATSEAEGIPLSEAAAQLGITRPRLQRLLQRPQWASASWKTERETRTGTRTVTLVRVSVLPALQTEIIEREREQDGPACSRSYSRSDSMQSRSASRDTSGQLEPLAAALLAEKDARIGELTAALEHERETTRRLTEALSREQHLRLLPPPASRAVSAVAPSAVSDTARGATRDTADDAAAPSAQNAPAAAPDGPETGAADDQGSERRRRWWQVWRRQEKEQA